MFYNLFLKKPKIFYQKMYSCNKNQHIARGTKWPVKRVEVLQYSSPTVFNFTNDERGDKN